MALHERNTLCSLGKMQIIKCISNVSHMIIEELVLTASPRDHHSFIKLIIVVFVLDKEDIIAS